MNQPQNQQHWHRYLALLAALAMSGCVAVGARAVTVRPGPTIPTPLPALLPTIPPLTPVGNLTTFDICIGVTSDMVGQTVGAQISTATPLASDPLFGVGCQYVILGSTPEDKSHYVNLFFAPEESFEQIRSISSGVTPVENVGDEAYTASRPEGPQLWALVKGRGAVGVAIGGEWTVNRARLLASYVIEMVR